MKYQQKMNYQQKIELAEKGVEFLSESNSIDDYKKILEKDGYIKHEIDKITSSIKNMLYEKYSENLNTALFNGTVDDKRSEFPLLSDELFKDFKDREIKNIINTTKKAVRKMVDNQIDPLKIVAATKNEFFPREDVASYIAKYTENKEVNNSDRRKALMGLGILQILAGIVLPIRIPLLFFALILIGLGTIITGLIGKSN